MERHEEDLRTSLNNMVSDVAVNMWFGSASDMHRVYVVDLSHTFLDQQPIRMLETTRLPGCFNFNQGWFLSAILQLLFNI